MTKLELYFLIAATIVIQIITAWHVTIGVMTQSESIIVSIICLGIIYLAVRLRRLTKQINKDR